jgi:hypothetical protein
MVLHMNTAQVLILKLIKQDHFYFLHSKSMGNLLHRGPRRGQHAECIHKPSRVRVVHYHYRVKIGGNRVFLKRTVEFFEN